MQFLQFTSPGLFAQLPRQPMGSESSTPQLDDCTFRLFLHDAHHAYLLLHRAFLQIPPTLIPNLESMPHPCHDDLQQPPGLQPFETTSPNQPDIDHLFRLATDQSLPHLAPSAKFPSPFDQYLLLMQNTALCHRLCRHHLVNQFLRAGHDEPGIPKPPKEPMPRLPSRSRSPMTSPRPWTEADIASLKTLKGNATAKHAWKVIAAQRE